MNERVGVDVSRQNLSLNSSMDLISENRSKNLELLRAILTEIHFESIYILFNKHTQIFKEKIERKSTGSDLDEGIYPIEIMHDSFKDTCNI